MTTETENDASKNWTEYKTHESSACSKATRDYLKPITRDEIRAALKKVYVEDTKPVNVGNVKARSGFALVLMVIGTIIISGVVGIKFLALEPYLMLIGLMLLLGTFALGFSLSTNNIRKIYLSMRRFKNMNVPSYRKVFPKTTFQTQGLVYATLLCLIFLGAQSVNILMLNSVEQNNNNDYLSEDFKTNQENIPTLIDVHKHDVYQHGSQNYFNIFVETNNCTNYYGENLIMQIQSWFAGAIYEEENVTLSKKYITEYYVPIKIHEPDDTAIKVELKYQEETGDQLYSTYGISSQKDIYIKEADGKVISKQFSISKSIEISVVVYNGGEDRVAESLSLIVTNPNVVGPLKYRDSTENNETVGGGEIWEYTFKFDILDEESVFDVELKIYEDTQDETRVYSS